MNISGAKARFVLLSALIFLLPAVLNTAAYDITGVKQLLLFISASLLCLTFIGDRTVHFKPAMLLPLLYIIWALVSAVFSKNDAFCTMPMLSYAALFTVFISASLITDDHKYMLRTVLIASAVIPLTAGIVQLVFPGAMSGLMQFGVRIPSVFGNPNFFGAWLALIFPVAMWRGLYGLGMRKWMNLLLSALCAVFIILSGSKAAMTGLALEVLVFGIYFVMQRGRTVAALVISVIFAALTVFFVFQIAHRVTESRESFFFRQNVWAGTAQLIKERAITGYGPGTFSTVFPAHRPDALMKWAQEPEYEVTYPENFLLQAAAETGITGMIILFLLCVFAVYLGLREEKEALDFGAALAGIFVINLFGVDMNFASTSAIIAVYAGILAKGSHEKNIMTLKKPLVFIVPVFFILFFGTYRSLMRELSSVSLERGISQAQQKDFGTAVRSFSDSVRYNPVNTDAAYFLGNALRDSGNSTAALTVYDTLEKIAPDFVSLPLKKAEIYLETGKTDQAASYYLRMLELDPYSEAAAFGLARCAFLLDTPQMAEAHILKALTKLTTSHVLYNALGNIYMLKNDPKSAAGAYKKAVDLHPAEDYHYNLSQAMKLLKKAAK